MYPDWPMLKDEIQRLYLRVLRDSTDRRTGFLSQVPKVALHEGNAHALQRADGTTSAAPMTRVSAEFIQTESDIENMSLRDMLASIDEKAETLARGRSEHTFRAMNEASEEAGTSVDAGGGPFTAELILAAWGRMEMSFDASGRPHLPTLVIPPGMKEVVAQQIRRLQEEPELRTRADRLLAIKREDWLAREADRILAG
jgi:hypothetical protein